MTNTSKEQALKESLRLFQCARCLKQVAICAHCDRGNIYCSQTCSVSARKNAHRIASQRYQLTPRGKEKHARRQQRYRERLKVKNPVEIDGVTDQGSPSGPCELSSLPMSEADTASQESKMGCDFCKRHSNGYARWHFLNHYRRDRRLSLNLSSASMAFAQGP